MNAFIAAITDALKSDNRVTLIGFGAFEVKQHAARTGRNPKANIPIEIPVSRMPVFKSGKALKETIF